MKPETARARFEVSDNRALSDTTPCNRLHGSEAGDALVTEYLLAARADNTRRAYDADLRHFQRWGGHLPSDTDEMARYLAQHATELRPVTLRRRLAALAAAHHDRGFGDPTKHPMVRRVMQGIERRHGAPPTQVAPLVVEDLQRVVSILGTSKSDIRDKAVLLAGFFGALRRSELVALEVRDIDWTPSGIVVVIGKSKTDQSAQGRRIYLASRDDILCPVAALRAWTRSARIDDGAVFRRGSTIRPICTRTIARVIKQRTAAAGLTDDRFSGHSLRAGYVTSAALAGENLALIACQTGHRSPQMVARYVRPAVGRLIAPVSVIGAFPLLPPIIPLVSIEIAA